MDMLQEEAIESRALSHIEDMIKQERRYHLRQWRRRARKRVALVLLLLLAVAGLTALLVGAVKINGSSMEPNLHQNDVAIYLRRATGYKAQDIIVFRLATGETLVKRVIAVGGDTVDVDTLTGRVSVNGMALDEPYAIGDGRHLDSVAFPLTVPDDQLFVLGDNRDVSMDSRNTEIGTLSLSAVMGKVITVLRTRL